MTADDPKPVDHTGDADHTTGESTDATPTTPPPPQPAAAPPTQQGNVPPPQTIWPVVLGVISIIYAVVFELVGASCGLIGAVIVAVAGNASETFMTAGPEYDSTLYRIYYVVMNLVWLGLGVLMLVGAIQLLRRRRVAARLLTYWAIGAVAAVAVSVPATFWVAIAQNDQYASAGGPGIVFGFVIVAFSLLFSLILPVFNLIWFRRRAIRAEMSAWT